jgi:hypothetical protein
VCRVPGGVPARSGPQACSETADAEPKKRGSASTTTTIDKSVPHQDQAEDLYVAQVSRAVEELRDLLGRLAHCLLMSCSWTLDPQDWTGGEESVGHRVVEGRPQGRVGAAPSAGGGS